LHLNSLSESYRRQQKAHRRIKDKLVVIEKKLVARASHVQSQRRDKGLLPGLTTSATFGPTEPVIMPYRNRYDLISPTRY